MGRHSAARRGVHRCQINPRGFGALFAPRRVRRHANSLYQKPKIQNRTLEKLQRRTALVQIAKKDLMLAWLYACCETVSNERKTMETQIDSKEEK